MIPFMEIDSPWRTRSIGEAQEQGYAPAGDLPEMRTHRRCPVAAVAGSEGHEPEHLTRQHSPAVPTVRERGADYWRASTQHCLRARTQEPTSRYLGRGVQGDLPAITTRLDR